MAALLGAFKGILGAVALLIVAALVPCIAWLTAAHTHEALGLGFAATFLIVLALEAFLGIAVLFGVASEVQEQHSQAIDDAAADRRFE